MMNFWERWLVAEQVLEYSHRGFPINAPEVPIFDPVIEE